MAFSFSESFKDFVKTSETGATKALSFLSGLKKKEQPVLKAEALPGAIQAAVKDKIQVPAEVPIKGAMGLAFEKKVPKEVREIGKKQLAEFSENIVLGTLAAPVKVVKNPVSSYLTKRVSTSLEEVKTPLKEKAYSKMSALYTAAVDRFNPIVKLTREAEKTGVIKPGQNPELLARRYLGVKGISESKLYWKTTKLGEQGNLIETGPGLSKVIEPMKDNLDDLRALLVAERDIELSKRGIIGSTPKESREILDHLSQRHGANFKTLEQTAQGVRDYTRRTILDPLRESGFLSDDSYKAITSSNEFYVPFKRVIDDMESQGFLPKTKGVFQPKGAGLKGIKGSERKIIDPLESIIQETYRVTDLLERHGVAKAVVNLRNASEELAQMIVPVKPKMVPVATEKGKTIFRPSFFNPKDNTIMVFENGARKFYEVAPDLAKAMNGLSAGDVNVIWKIMGLPARTLRAGATLAPEFSLRNPFRDQFSAMIQSKYGYRPGIDMVEGFWNLIGKKDVYQRWLASGGAQSELVALDRISAQKTLQQVAQKQRGEKIITYVNPLESLRAISAFGESGTRLGAFRRALKKGATDIEAAFEARDITLDFARTGTATKEINKIIAFFNANIQGTDKLVRTFAQRPAEATFKAVVGLTLPTIGLFMVNKDNPRYQELPQWRKDLFWNVFIDNPTGKDFSIVVPLFGGVTVGKEGVILSLAKPFTLGTVFSTVPEHIMQWIHDNDPDQLKNIPSALQAGVVPGSIPTIMTPILENTANYSFFRDRPIVSEGLQNLPPELQASTYTSETAKEIGKLIKASPNKIENLVNGYFAGLGRYGLQISDEILKALNVVEVPEPPEGTLADTPAIRAFIAKEPIGSGSESVNKFFTILEKAEQAEAAAKKLSQGGDIEGAAKYMKDHKEVFFVKSLRKLSRDFSDIRKAKDAVYQSTSLSPQEKRKTLDEFDSLMTEMARQALTLIKESQ